MARLACATLHTQERGGAGERGNALVTQQQQDNAALQFRNMQPAC